MSPPATYGITVDLDGVQITVPARFAVACGEDRQPIPGAEVREITVEATAAGHVGLVDAWPGLPVRSVGLARTADGPVLFALPLFSAAHVPGDSIRIGPMTEVAAGAPLS